MKNTAAGVPFILICVLLDILGIGLIIPVLPQLVGDLAGSQSAQAWWLGAMLVAYGLMQFCFAPTLGALSDRYGRRPVLLLGIFGLGIMFLVPALSQSLPVILFSRILGGMFAGNIAVAQAYISDVTDKAHRAAAFGKLGACFGIGFILGPALGGILGENDVRLPFFIAGCLSLLNFLYGIFVLPESLKTREHRAINFKTLNPLSSLARLTKFKYIGALIAVIALSGFAQSMLHSTWTLFTNFRFHWTFFGRHGSRYRSRPGLPAQKAFKIIRRTKTDPLRTRLRGSSLPLLRTGHLRPPDLLGDALQFPVHCRSADAEFHRLSFRPGIRTGGGHGNHLVCKQFDGSRRASARDASFGPYGGAEPGIYARRPALLYLRFSPRLSRLYRFPPFHFCYNCGS